MGLKERVQKQQKQKSEQSPSKTQQNSPIGNELAGYVQSYLAWLKVQNPNFAENLTTEELANYFYGKVKLPEEIMIYMESNPLQTLSKVYEYIDRYKDKTDMFAINKKIIPKDKGNYKEV